MLYSYQTSCRLQDIKKGITPDDDEMPPENPQLEKRIRAEIDFRNQQNDNSFYEILQAEMDNDCIKPFNRI